jgi:Na+-driven multidrug efflux pump
VIVQIIQYTILLPFGVAVAATIRVGNFLGKNAAEEARRAAISSLMLAFIACMLAAPCHVLCTATIGSSDARA